MLAELLFDVYAWGFETDEGFDLKAGGIVEILEEYQDEGMWSDGDPFVYESPFPAFVFRLDGLKYHSVHTKAFKVLE